jgi:hypothetical protein
MIHHKNENMWWVGVTIEPLYQRENYIPEYNTRENYNCDKITTDCSSISTDKCDKYYKIEDDLFVPCMKKGNKCKANTADSTTKPQLKYNKCGNSDDGYYICDDPCYPYKFFEAAPTCDIFNGSNDANVKKCLSSYKEGSPSSGEHDVYCKANISRVGNLLANVDCKPSHTKVIAGSPPI